MIAAFFSGGNELSPDDPDLDIALLTAHYMVSITLAESRPTLLMSVDQLELEEPESMEFINQQIESTGRQSLY